MYQAGGMYPMAGLQGNMIMPMGGFAGGMGMGGAGGFAQADQRGFGMGGQMQGRGPQGRQMAGANSRSRQDSEFVEGKLFLGGLDNHTTKETLLQYAEQWGEVADYVLMEGRGFGFVTFRDVASAQTFLETREHVIDGKKVEAKAAVPKNSGSGNTLTKKMFVGGTGEIADDEFQRYFEQYGEIDDCVVLRKPDGGSRGFGFVTFKDEMSVEKCLVVQHVLNGRQVELKRAVKKEDMANANAGVAMPSVGMTGAGGGGSAQGPTRTGKAPDWMCPDCNNKNFGWREICNRCHVPKPTGLTKNGNGMGMGMGMMGTSSAVGGMNKGSQRLTGGGFGSMGDNFGNIRTSMGSYDAAAGMSGMPGMVPAMNMAGMGMNMGMPIAAYGMGQMAGYGMGGMPIQAMGTGGMAGGGMGLAGQGYSSYGAGQAGGQGYGAYGSQQGGYGRAQAGRGSSQNRYRPY